MVETKTINQETIKKQSRNTHLHLRNYHNYQNVVAQQDLNWYLSKERKKVLKKMIYIRFNFSQSNVSPLLKHNYIKTST